MRSSQIQGLGGSDSNETLGMRIALRTCPVLGPVPMDSANAKMVALAPARKLSVCRALRMTMRVTAIIKSLHKETQRAKAAASTPISSSSDSTSEEDEQQCKNITKEKARAKKLQCQCPLQPLAPPKYQPKNKAGTKATTAKAISSKKNKEKVSKKDKGKEKKKKEEAAKKK